MNILSKRRFSRATGLIVVAGTLLAACGGQPQVVEKIVEKPVEVIKEVIKEVPGKEVIKEVVVTKEVQVAGKDVIKEVVKEVVVTATPVVVAPKFKELKEAPMLTEMVKAGAIASQF